MQQLQECATDAGVRQNAFSSCSNVLPQAQEMGQLGKTTMLASHYVPCVTD
jgi:hypothetical protein